MRLNQFVVVNLKDKRGHVTNHIGVPTCPLFQLQYGSLVAPPTWEGERLS